MWRRQRFEFPILFVGIGERLSAIMIVLYTILPLLKNTHASAVNIDRNLVDVGVVLDMKSFQLLLHVQPPVVRDVSCTGRSGFMVNGSVIMAGALPAMVSTLLVEKLLKFVENFLIPRGLKLWYDLLEVRVNASSFSGGVAGEKCKALVEVPECRLLFPTPCRLCRCAKFSYVFLRS